MQELAHVDAAHGEVRVYLERLLAAPLFAAAPRRARLMRYLVERTLAGEGDQVNEYSIAVDVFGKPPSFDPRIHSTVRTDVTRLRQKLRQYYEGEGRADSIQLDVLPRAYRIAITHRQPAAADEAVETAVAAAPISPTVVSAGSKWFHRTWMWIVGAALVGALGIIVIPRLFSAPHADHIQSIVVLPFRDFSSDHHSGYLADGLTDELTDNMANVKGLRVIARTSAFQFKDKAIDVREIGRRLKVDAALEGSIDREGNHIHVRAQLNRTADGYHLWSRVYDTEFQDLINVQRDLARWIADDLQARSSSGSNRIPVAATTNPEAHELYLRGLNLYENAAIADYDRGVLLMQSAIAKDPHYAAPWYVMAKMRETTGWVRGWPPGTIEQVRTDLEQALERDPSLADAHANLALLDWDYGYDWPSAEREFQLALEPGDRKEPHKLYGWALADRGRFAESEKHLQMAEDIAPGDLELLFILGGIQMWEHKFSDAERTLQSILQSSPDSIPPLATLVTLKITEKDCTGAGEYASRLERVEPSSFRAVFARGAVDVCEGDKSGAVKLLARQASVLRNAPAFELAKMYAYMGDKDKAIQYLEEAVNRHEFGATSMEQQPLLQSLHGDARFIALARRVGLPG